MASAICLTWQISVSCYVLACLTWQSCLLGMFNMYEDKHLLAQRFFAANHLHTMLSKPKAVRVQEAKPQMDAICAEYRDNPSASIGALMESGKAVLLQHGLADRSVRLHAKYTITHPRNRGQFILEPSNIGPMVADIVDVGFIMSETADASGVRMPTGPKAEEIEAKNAELVRMTGDMLAPIVPGMAQLQVTACSHNSAGLRNIYFESPCSIPSISEGGRYSSAKIIGKQPSYRDPIESGLFYFMMEYEVEEAWPDFIDLVIEASNVSQQLAKADTPLQLMQKIHVQAKAYNDKNQEPQYDTIISKMLRTKPTYAEDIPTYKDYVKSWSGGYKDPTFLNLVIAFARTLPCVHPILTNVLKPLVDADIGFCLGARYRAAALMAIGRFRSAC